MGRMRGDSQARKAKPPLRGGLKLFVVTARLGFGGHCRAVSLSPNRVDISITGAVNGSIVVVFCAFPAFVIHAAFEICVIIIFGAHVTLSLIHI